MYSNILFIRFPGKDILFLLLIFVVLGCIVYYYYTRIYDNGANESKAKNKKDVLESSKNEESNNSPAHTDIPSAFPDNITMINTDVSYGIIEVIAHYNNKQKILTKLYFDAEILSDSPVVLGRGQKNESSLRKVTIPVIYSATQKSSVSTYHATLSYNTEKDVFILTDGCNGKPSRNGTFSDEKKIDEIALLIDTSVYLGLNNEIELIFHPKYINNLN